jgi:4'-phosphopantetheinyl transferase
MHEPHASTASSPLPAQSGDLLVVVTPLRAEVAELARLEGLLAPDERARVARFPELLRGRFVAGRARLRRLLGRLLDERPEGVEFEYGRWGKPCLGGRHAGRLHFNLTHCRDHALAAFCRARPVGIDIELPTAAFTVEWSERMATSILGRGEQAAWRSLPDGLKPAALLEAWVAKEAALKAVGCGIGGGLERVCLPPSEAMGDGTSIPWHAAPVVVELPVHDDLPGGAVAIRGLDVVPGAFAAVACLDTISTVVTAAFDTVLAAP